jgi:hypothetical protein
MPVKAGVLSGDGGGSDGGFPFGPTGTDPGGVNEIVNPEGMIVVISPITAVTPAALFTGLPQGAFFFQCPPINEMPREKTWQWEDYGTIASGIHSNPNYPNPNVVTFDTLFVDEDWGHSFATRLPGQTAAPSIAGPRFAVANLPNDVLWAADWLERLGDTMKPFVLSYGQRALWGRWDRVMGATLRSLRVSEKGGENDARYLTVSFSEFNDVSNADLGSTILPGVPGSSSTSGVTDENGQPVLAVLDSSSLPPTERTLSNIAKVFYADPTLWRIIAAASNLLDVTANQDLPTTIGLRNPPAKIIVPFRPRTGN